MLACLAAAAIIFGVVLFWVAVQHWSGQGEPQFRDCHSLGDKSSACQQCGMKDECDHEDDPGPPPGE